MRPAASRVLPLLVLLSPAAGLAAPAREWVDEDQPLGRASASRAPLRYSRFPGRSADEIQYDLFCPHTVEPNPLVVVAPDQDQPLDQADLFTLTLVGAGFIVVAVEPRPGRADYAAAIEVVLAEVLATPPDPREPGCRRSGGIGAFGLGRGGAAVLELAARRERDNNPLGGAMVGYVAEAGAQAAILSTPTLVVEGRRPAPPGRSLVIADGSSCDLRWYFLDCEPDDSTWSLQRRRREADLRHQRANAFTERLVAFMRAHVEGDADALAAARSWPPEIEVRRSDESLALDEKATHVVASLPYLLGGTTQGDGGTAMGLRPEVMVARVASHRALNPGTGFGLGLYGELLRARGDGLYGGGLTLVAYLGRVAIAPSVGLYGGDRDHGRGISTGLFFGLRHPVEHFEFIDLPLGIRVDIHSPFGDSSARSMFISAQADLVYAGLFAALFSRL
jgi:hypothetical protein